MEKICENITANIRLNTDLDISFRVISELCDNGI